MVSMVNKILVPVSRHWVPAVYGSDFFAYGERSYIGVHDNMDLFLAQFQMLKNTDSFWKHGVDVPFLGGVSRNGLPSEFSLYSLLYMLFPTYIAYILGLLGKMLLGMFSFWLLTKELLGDRFRRVRPIVFMTGLCYGTLWVFPPLVLPLLRSRCVCFS